MYTCGADQRDAKCTDELARTATKRTLMHGGFVLALVWIDGAAATLLYALGHAGTQTVSYDTAYDCLFCHGLILLPLLAWGELGWGVAFAAVAVVCGLLFRKRRDLRAFFVVAALVSLSMIGALRTSEASMRWIEWRSMAQVAQRAETLRNAIHAYHRAHEEYPQDLSVLVPRFIQAIPNTGLGISPRFLYELGAPEFAGIPYVLAVAVSQGGLDDDLFVYAPFDAVVRLSRQIEGVRVGDWVCFRS